VVVRPILELVKKTYHISMTKPQVRFSSLLSRNLGVFQTNAESLKQKDFLVQTDTDGLHFNWILGHVLHSRQILLEALGAEPSVKNTEILKAYSRGSKTQAAEIMSSQDLLQALEVSQAALEKSLEDADFASPSPMGKGTLEDYFELMTWQETYHAGQSGVLRRLAGFAGQI
jgi:DinB superfamily